MLLHGYNSTKLHVDRMGKFPEFRAVHSRSLLAVVVANEVEALQQVADTEPSSQTHHCACMQIYSFRPCTI